MGKNPVNNLKSIMSSRIEPIDSLDFFPTPPWASRSLILDVFLKYNFFDFDLKNSNCLEPACGEGHMSEVLKEFFGKVIASDVHNYGKGYDVFSYVGSGLDVLPSFKDIDFIITNPPFNLASEFLKRALIEAKYCVAFLLRTVWIEGEDRWSEIFSVNPPDVVAQFVERVPMRKGYWDPSGSTATAYAWFIWFPFEQHKKTELLWIPPGAALRNSRSGDIKKFASHKITKNPSLFD